MYVCVNVCVCDCVQHTLFNKVGMCECEENVEIYKNMSNKSAESLQDEKGVNCNTVHHSGENVDTTAVAIKISSCYISRS